MAQHFKQLNLKKLLKQVLKPKGKGKHPSKSFLSILPPWVIDRIDKEREKDKPIDDRPVLELPRPPSEFEIVWPPPAEKKEDPEKDRGIAIIQIMKRS